LTANGFTRTGYKFDSWNTSADGKGTKYTDKASVKNLTTRKDGVVNLYAQWTANTYTVTFNYNGGSGSETERYIVYGGSYGTLPTPSTDKGNSDYCDKNCCYTYYDFSYWKDEDGNEVKNNSGMYVPRNHTLTAVWASDRHTESHDTCLAAGTLITLADGTQKKVEELKLGDKILAWDFVTQSFVETPITLFVYHGDDSYNVLKLFFEDGSVVKVIGKHVFFDVTLKEYVTITEDNYEEFIGHEFLAYNVDDYKLSKLVSAEVVVETTGSYAIVTAYYFNAVTDNIISCTPTIPIYELISSYVQDDLTFDVEQFEKDVETYGLYEYSLFSEYLTVEQFDQLAAAYFKLAEGKGYTTFEEIYTLMVMFSYVYG
jgi:uncharacterized repeat protein (TIGR02543 family)